jgi:hypothetical protein
LAQPVERSSFEVRLHIPKCRVGRRVATKLGQRNEHISDLDRLKEIRDQLKGDFESKIKKMDEITGAIKRDQQDDNK